MAIGIVWNIKSGFRIRSGDASEFSDEPFNCVVCTNPIWSISIPKNRQYRFHY